MRRRERAACVVRNARQLVPIAKYRCHRRAVQRGVLRHQRLVVCQRHLRGGVRVRRGIALRRGVHDGRGRRVPRWILLCGWYRGAGSVLLCWVLVPVGFEYRDGRLMRVGELWDECRRCHLLICRVCGAVHCCGRLLLWRRGQLLHGRSVRGGVYVRRRECAAACVRSCGLLLPAGVVLGHGGSLWCRLLRDERWGSHICVGFVCGPVHKHHARQLLSSWQQQYRWDPMPRGERVPYDGISRAMVSHRMGGGGGAAAALVYCTAVWGSVFLVFVCAGARTCASLWGEYVCARV